MDQTLRKALNQRQEMTHEEAMRHLKGLMRDAVRQTQRFDALWNRLNDELTAKFTAEGVRDIVQLTNLKSASIPLNDAYSAGVWWRAKAAYLAEVIQAEIMLKEVGL